MDRPQPKAGHQIEDAFSHRPGPRDQGGKADCFLALKGAAIALSRPTAT